MTQHYTTVTSGGSKGGEGHAPPGLKFLHFHADLGKIGQIYRLAHPPPHEILDPPLVTYVFPSERISLISITTMCGCENYDEVNSAQLHHVPIKVY